MACSALAARARCASFALALALLPVACGGGGGAAAQPSSVLGKLRLTSVDVEGRATPARVELRDASGRTYIPGASLRFAGACSTDAPSWWTDGALDEAPPTGIVDPDTGATQFYVAAPIEVDLAPGLYTLSAHKGLEYRVASIDVEVRAKETTHATLTLARWIDLPAEGWFGGDPHLHVARTAAALDAAIADWMRAEDVRVASLLQSGEHGGRIESAPQRAFGDAAVRQDGDTIVASGQENPRTWLLGHGIILGAERYLDEPRDYLAYDAVWRAARTQGGLLGYAHFSAPGLLLDAPDGLVDFLEVLQFDVANYDALYELWTLGFRVSPFAGTDHPCAPSGVPGSQRLYARLDDPLSYRAWLDAIRAGRTFVTNGPMLDLSVDGVATGGDVTLARPGTVRVRSHVRFDPARDDVQVLEVVRDGEVVATAAPHAPGEALLEADVAVRGASWLAARTRGTKPSSAGSHGRLRDSHAHTGNVRVVVAGSRDAAGVARRAAVASALAARLDELEARVDADGIDATGRLPEEWTGVMPEILRAGQAHLLERVARARAFYRRVVAEAASP